MTEPLPALYLGHGAPPLLEEPTWDTKIDGYWYGLAKRSIELR